MRNSILFLKCTFNCALEKFTQVMYLKFAGKLDQNKNKNINKISPKNLQNIGTKMQILVKDPKNGEELNMIEMQGDLESRLGANVDVSGKFIGDLHYTKDGGIPILIIGHHILYGKKVKLESPMVAMKKVRTVQGDQTVTEYHVETVIRSKLIFKARPKPIIVVPKKM